jgi:hypothetical protein
VLFNRLYDFFVSFMRVVKSALREDHIERGPVGETLAFGNLGNMVTLVEMVCVAVNKSVIAQENLTFDLRPDGFFVYSPCDELTIFLEELWGR